MDWHHGNNELALSKAKHIFIRLIGSCLSAMAITMPWLGSAFAGPPSEATIKAAFMANVVQFTEWPEKNSPTSRVHLCVTGRSPTADALIGLDGQTAFGRTFSTSVRKRPAEALDCHVLFLAETSSRPPAEWIHELADRPILTVSEVDEFALMGGVIGLYRDGNRVAFDVSISAMHRANLRISAHLLKLARNIVGQ